jgi:hypothetical protein
MSQIELEERSYDIYRKRERLLDNTPIRYTSSGITDAIYFHDNIDNNALIFYDED